ncbi:CHAT domain-containing protein [Candidatus Uabimicrobium amorphum]|nr:CHAT domain-containing protein [Candidatus Uabimicrobium amorphum]
MDFKNGVWKHRELKDFRVSLFSPYSENESLNRWEKIRNQEWEKEVQVIEKAVKSYETKSTILLILLHIGNAIIGAFLSIKMFPKKVKVALWGMIASTITFGISNFALTFIILDDARGNRNTHGIRNLERWLFLSIFTFGLSNFTFIFSPKKLEGKILLQLRLLKNKARLYARQNQYTKAEFFYQRSLKAIQNKNLYFETAELMSEIAILYQQMGEYTKAKHFHTKANSTVEHPKVLNKYALWHEEKGEKKEAEELRNKAFQSIKKQINKDPKNEYLHASLAEMYQDNKNYNQSEKTYLQAIELAKTNFSLIEILKNFALFYVGIQLYPRAEDTYIKLIEETQTTLGTHNSIYISLVSDIALLSKEMRKYKESEEFFCENMQVIENVLGKNHLIYIFNHIELANLYSQIGEYGKAEPIYTEILNIVEQMNEKNSFAYASCLNQMGKMYYKIDEYDKAEKYYEKAKQIYHDVLGEYHPEYKACLMNELELYQKQRKSQEVNTLINEIELLNEQQSLCELPENTEVENLQVTISLDVDTLNLIVEQERLKQAQREQQVNEQEIIAAFLQGREENFTNALQMSQNAILLYRKKEYKKALVLQKKASEIIQKTHGKNDRCYVTALNNLAKLYDKTGNYEIASELFSKAVNLRGKILGTEHPDYATSLENLAHLQYRQKKKQSALFNMLKAANVHNKMILRIFSIGDEKRLEKYIDTFEIQYFTLLSIFYQSYKVLHIFSPQVCDLILKRKSLHRELTSIKRDSLFTQQRPDLEESFARLRQIKLQIAQLILASTDASSTQIAKLEAEKEQLERVLAAEVPELELEKKLTHVSHREIAKLLPADSLLVDFVCFREVDVESMRYLDERYIAIVIYNEQISKELAFVDLGAASEIDELISKYKKQLTTGERKIHVVAEDVLPSENTTVKTQDAYGEQLFQKVFAPVLRKTKDCKRLILSPDGGLCLLPFEVLPQPDERFVVEDYEISYIDSGKDLLRFGYQTAPKSQPVVIANPDFSLSGDQSYTDIRNSIPQSIVAELGQTIQRKVQETKAQYYFPPLAATHKEGVTIGKMLPREYTSLMEEKALDSAIKKLQAPQILHFATHGFFMVDEQQKETDLDEMQDLNESPIFRGEKFRNPLLRSGLALAGANTFFENKQPAPDAEDGLLTALDITGMDLFGTDLVVLSACETAVGEVKIGQGVYGLRHSFIIAGARTLIASLWKVPDEETKELMVGFYRKILRGSEKATALRETQLEMIQKLRDTGKSPDPYLWGAFICVGDPGKMNL